MPTDQVQAAPLWPLIVYFAAVVILVSGIVGLSSLLGQRSKNRSEAMPFESGMFPTGSPRLRFDILFYLNAIFFVVLDVEVMFILAWAIAFRNVGWVGYITIVLFVITLLVALIYLWRVGALDWRTYRQKIDSDIPEGGARL
jgi:NADH-quinone oxidoreductase subunit A